MAARKGGLGKGIDSLIPQNKSNTTEKPVKVDGTKVKIEKVEPNREQPRKNFDEDALQELSDSIKQYGILQPIVVVDRGDYYMIIAGERRWRAAMLAGLKEVPVIIKDLTEQEIVEISLIENIQREDLNPIEEALAYKKLLEEFNLKQDEVAERVSKSRTAVTNSVRLLKLDDRVQQMVIDDMISTGHARALLGIENKEEQYAKAQQVFDQKLSVRETEKLVKQHQNEKKNPVNRITPAIDTKTQAIYKGLEEQLKNKFGTKVSIQAKDENKGKIEIEYFSSEELSRIIDLIASIQ